MKKIFLPLVMFLFISHNVLADLESTIDNIKHYVETAKCHTKYYAPYALGTTIGLGSFSVGPKFGAYVFAGLGLYTLYTTYEGYKEIKNLEKKYQVKTKAADYWNNFYHDEYFLFCRWRQQDDRFGDGYYWPTAWLCNEERYEVRNKLIQDMHAQRIVIMLNGRKMSKPKPSDVIKALHNELNELEHDKKRLQAYTTIYRGIECPEAFHPSTNYSRILWPNFNRASKTYIELVQMMKRLEVLLDIVASVGSEISGGGWPKS